MTVFMSFTSQKKLNNKKMNYAWIKVTKLLGFESYNHLGHIKENLEEINVIWFLNFDVIHTP